MVLTAIALGLASCSKEDGYTEQQRACIAQRYKDYDARHLASAWMCA